MSSPIVTLYRVKHTGNRKRPLQMIAQDYEEKPGSYTRVRGKGRILKSEIGTKAFLTAKDAAVAHYRQACEDLEGARVEAKHARQRLANCEHGAQASFGFGTLHGLNLRHRVPGLTPEHLYAIKAVEHGADVYSPLLARHLREVQNKRPELIDIVPDQMYHGDGTDRVPYFGAIATEAGRAFVSEVADSAWDQFADSFQNASIAIDGEPAG